MMRQWMVQPDDATASRGSATLPRYARHRRLTAIVLAWVLGVNTGCYTYGPVVSTAPKPGDVVAIEISDQGRVRLGEQLGAGVTRVEGTLRGFDGSEYLLAVSRVSYLGNSPSRWGGERVRLTTDAVARVQERRFSKGRTLLAVGVAVVGLGAFIVSRGLLGFGNEAPDPPSRLPPGDQ